MKSIGKNGKKNSKKAASEKTQVSKLPVGRSGRLKKEAYEKELRRLQTRLVRLQEWVRNEGLKVVVLFEGRDAAGKGGVIKRITERLSPRLARVVALGTPTEREKSQWYFQRYVPHLPAAGEMCLFDGSWYNRAGIERVMGFCSAEEAEEYYRSCPEFERMLVRSGIILIKYWFSVSDDVQEKRFQERMDDPRKRWKLSPIDLEALGTLGGILPRQGRHVPSYRHQTSAVVRRGCGRQASGPPELYSSSAQSVALRGSAALHTGTPSSPAGHRICPASTGRGDLRPVGLLSVVV